MIAVLERPILVRQIAEAHCLEAGRHRLGMFGPVLLEDATNGQRPVVPVQRAVEIDVALELAEVGQHGVPAPAAGAALLPLVVSIGPPRLASCPLMLDPPPRTRACSYFLSLPRGRPALWEPASVVTRKSFHRKRLSRNAWAAKLSRIAAGASSDGCHGRPRRRGRGWRSGRTGGWRGRSRPFHRRRSHSRIPSISPASLRPRPGSALLA